MDVCGKLEAFPIGIPKNHDVEINFKEVKSVLLTGSGEYIIDSKKRMALPKEMRLELGEHVYVSPGFEKGSLAIFPPETLEELRDNLKKQMFTNTLDAHRKLFSSSKRVQIDTQGRILISQEILDIVKLNPEDKVKVLGCGDYIEIWPLEIYNARYADEEVDLREIFRSAGL
ncbi:MAG: hypothetical protein E7675_02485 [Ruminococcaceae bacterium]|nr:hypothetical protein [Oscillospiraceae bacterium]